MKKLLLLKSLLFLCALIVGTSAWADTATLTNAEIVAQGAGADGYRSLAITGGGGKTWNAYAIKNQHSKATSSYHYLQLKKYASGTASYIQIPEYGTKITSITMTVSSTSKAMDGGDNSATLYFSASNSTSSTGTGVASGTGASSVTINCSSLNLNTGYITTSAGVRIWDVEVTYTVPSLDPSISLSTNSVNASSEDSDGTIDVTYNNIASVDSEVLFYESDGTTPADYSSWLAAEIDKSNNVYYVIGENTGAARTGYMKVHQKNTAVYSELITITQSQPASVTLDFTSNDWGISASPTKTVDATEFTSGGYTITLEGSADNGYYFDTNNIMLGKSGATLTLPAFGFNVSKIKVYGTASSSASVKFNIFVGANAVSTEATSSQVDHEFTIAADKRDVGTIYVIKVTNANNMRISKIEVYGNGCEAGLVQSYGWATYIPTADVEYPANTAYVVTDASVSTGLTLAEVTQVPSGTPLLLKGAGAKTAIKLDVTPSAPATNLLTVSDGSALSAGSYPYVLAKNGEGACFKQWTGAMSTLNGRVMLVLDEAVATARGIFELDDETTGVAEVRSKMTDGRSEYFNLAGQRVAQPTKGLYIVNGKKVIIK